MTEQYDEGRIVRVDNGSNFKYSKILNSFFGSGITTVTLASSVVLPSVEQVCTSIVGPNSIIDDYVFNYSTLQVAVDSTDISEGDAINIKERTSGNGGGGVWDAVLASSVTTNAYNIVSCTGVPALALVLRVDGYINIKQLGAVGDGVTNDTDVVLSSEAIANDLDMSVYYPKGIYLVSNFYRSRDIFRFGDGAKWKVGSTEFPIPSKNNASTGEMVVYVDAATGSDSTNCGITPSTAFKSPQFAYDTLPSSVKHDSVIQMADGTYNTTPRSTASMPRPSMLYCNGKTYSDRTSFGISGLKGSVVFKGNLANKNAVTIETTGSYNYGIYNQEGQIGLQSLTIKSGHASTGLLLTSHRTNSYVHCVDVVVDGNSLQASGGIIGESTGVIEFTGSSEIIGCIIGLSALAGGYVQMSGDSKIHDCTTGVQAIQSTVSLFNTNNSSSPLEVVYSCSTSLDIQDSNIEIRGFNSADKSMISSAVRFRNSSADLINVEIDAGINAKTSNLFFQNSAFQGQLSMESSSAHLLDTETYISGQTENSSTNPISMKNSSYSVEGTTIINGAGGSKLNTKNPVTHNYASNETKVVSVEDAAKIRDGSVYRVTGGSSDQTGCQISTNNFAEGDVIHVQGDSWGVQFVNGGAMDIPTSFYVGVSIAQYTGVTLGLYDGKWRILGLGQVR